MNKIIIKILWGIGFLIGAVVLFFADIYLWKLVSAGTGIEAKMLGSGVFISKREPSSVMNEDLHQKVNFIQLEVDHYASTITATAFGLITRKAYYREGLGCTLLTEDTENIMDTPVLVNLKPQPPKQRTFPWPTGDKIEDKEPPPQIDTVKMQTALDSAFSEPNSEIPRRTRAVVVLYDGKIVGERYAMGFSQATPLLGYGMAQSSINALVGLLVGQGKLTVDESVDVDIWRKSADGRNTITLDNLLRMSSGLTFDDSKPPLTDTVQMLGQADMASFAADKPLLSQPGQTWAYSNGTPNIICSIIRNAFGDDDKEYWAFPRRALFDKIGMRNSVIEPDASGNFVGSSYMYASARDWARFGLLYMQDGIWEGERLLPEGWVTYSTTPSAASPNEIYGAHFWLHPGGARHMETGRSPNIPEDAFFALGHDGQSLTVIPSMKLVIVRLGLTQDPSVWDINDFLDDVIAAVK